MSIVSSFMEMETYQRFDIISKFTIGGFTAAVALLVLLQTKKDSKGTWERCFSDLHSQFWSDPEIREVRKWLVNEMAYQTLEPILKRRMVIGRKKEIRGSVDFEISDEEYEFLDKLDKFLNFLSRIAHLVPVTKEQVKTWEDFFFGYWLKKCFNQGKKEFEWYIEEFYPILLKANLTLVLKGMGRNREDKVDLTRITAVSSHA